MVPIISRYCIEGKQILEHGGSQPRKKEAKQWIAFSCGIFFLGSFRSELQVRNENQQKTKECHNRSGEQPSRQTKTFVCLYISSSFRVDMLSETT